MLTAEPGAQHDYLRPNIPHQPQRIYVSRRHGIPEVEAGATGGRWLPGRLGWQLRSHYDGGASIQALAAQTSRSYGFVRRLLIEAGTEMRLRGGDQHRRTSRPRHTTAASA